ncbi:MAG: M20/M25/M40 family metallo-hydrolase [Clostridiales bacterium]|nr:M20/M25/M40 family metallo-hydrolase [Clostridiales bacterium]
MDTNKIIDRFIKYVKTDSQSRDEIRFCDLITEELEALGFEVTKDYKAAEKCGSNGYNIYARLPGEGTPILLSAHLDTVFPGKNINPIIENGVIHSDGTTILGADDKAGICSIISAMTYIKENNIPHRPVEILFTLCEELGLLGSRYADYSMIESKQAVVFDTDNVGEIINSAAANMVLHFDFFGKAAHAGISPENGKHALKAAVEAIYNIPVGHVDDISVMNVSNFLAPGKTNVICNKASFDMEIRSLKEERLQEHIQATLNTVEKACKAYDVTFQYETDRHSNVIAVDKDSTLIKEVVSAYEKLGVSATLSQTFGGCDATNLCNAGIEAVNVGIGMQDVHGCNEYIKTEDLITTTGFVINLLSK